jgi:chromatin assembly factor 1 subunit B
VLFKKENDKNEIFDLPYKMIFAIATIDQVLLYSTSSLLPVAIFGNMHYASITDLSFKGCSVLGVSSCDGFCSFI